MDPAAPGPPIAKEIRRLAFAGAALLLVMVSAVGLDEVVWRGAHAAAVVSAVSSAILDPGAIFAARSPGARDAGPLQQTKHERVAAKVNRLPAPEEPEERVLASLRERPPEPEFTAPEGALPLDGPPPIFTGPTTFAPGPVAPGPYMPGPIQLSSLPMTPPGGGGPPGDGPTPPNTPPNTPVLTPVPEPAAWLLMSLAAFGAGAALRRARSRRRTARAAGAASHA